MTVPQQPGPIVELYFTESLAFLVCTTEAAVTLTAAP